METIDEVTKVNIIHSTESILIPLCGQVRKQDGTWHLTVDSRENNVILPFYAAISDIGTILEELNTH